MIRFQALFRGRCSDIATYRTMASISGNKFLRQQAYINGEWVEAVDGAKKMDVLNPANGERIAEVPVMKRDDVVRACEVANTAWTEWKRTTAKVCPMIDCSRSSTCVV